MFFASPLIGSRAICLRKAAIQHAIVVGRQRRTFPGLHAYLAVLRPSALAVIRGADRGIEPVKRRPIKSLAENETFCRAVAGFGNHEPGASTLLERKSCVWKVQNGNGEQPEIAVLDVNSALHFYRQIGRVKAPDRVRGIADRDPCVLNAIGILIEAFGFLRAEVERVGADEESGCRAALDCEGRMDVIEFTAPRPEFI